MTYRKHLDRENADKDEVFKIFKIIHNNFLAIIKSYNFILYRFIFSNNNYEKYDDVFVYKDLNYYKIISYIINGIKEYTNAINITSNFLYISNDMNIYPNNIRSEIKKTITLLKYKKLPYELIEQIVHYYIMYYLER